MHIESNVGRFSQNKSLLYQNDPIYEEVEESDELNSENNFYIQWDQHKKNLLTQDEQVKLMNEDALSQTDIFKKKEPKLKRKHFRCKKKQISRNRSEIHILESIEEQNHEKDDLLEEDEESKQ